MNEKEDKIMYLVPANVSAKFELFPGFGWKELITVSAIVSVLFIVATLIGIPQKTTYKDPSALMVTEGMTVNENGQIEVRESIVPLPVRVVVVILLSGFTFFLVKREPTSGISPIDSIKKSINFSKHQQRSSYKYNSGNRG